MNNLIYDNNFITHAFCKVNFNSSLSDGIPSKCRPYERGFH